MKRCACIDTLYTELPFEERFAAAKKDGFESVEFWDWRIRDLKKVRAAAEADRGNQNPVKGKKRPDRSGIPRAVPQQRLHVQPRNQMEIA